MKQKKNRTRMERAYRRLLLVNIASAIVWVIDVIILMHIMTTYAS